MVAVCDVDDRRLIRAKETVNERYQNEDCFATKDFREVLARKDIDAVMISTPDHWHTLISLLAIQAGKDVQCEKPTLTIHEGKVLVEAVRKHKKVFQTSTEDRAVPEYHRMAELVRNGRIGKLQRIEVILPKQPGGPGDPTPQPVPAGAGLRDVAGPGPVRALHQGPRPFQLPLDLGLLGRDHLRLGRAPVRHRAMGQRHRAQRPGRGRRHRHALGRRPLQHGQGLRRHLPLRQRRGHDLQAGQPEHQVHRHRRLGGQHRLARRRCRPVPRRSSNPRSAPTNSTSTPIPKGEHDDFLQCVKSRKDPYFPVDIGHRVSTVCHLANIAIKVGRKLKWDPVKEQFLGDDAANAMLDRPRRDPWQLPKL